MQAKRVQKTVAQERKSPREGYEGRSHKHGGEKKPGKTINYFERRKHILDINGLHVIREGASVSTRREMSGRNRNRVWSG